MKVYAIFYNYNNEMQFEGITTDFKKWLINHNKERMSEQCYIKTEHLDLLFKEFKLEDLSACGKNVIRFLEDLGYDEEDIGIIYDNSSCAIEDEDEFTIYEDYINVNN